MKSILSLILSNHPRISLSSHHRDRDLARRRDHAFTLHDPTNHLPADGGESGNVTIALAPSRTFPPFSLRKTIRIQNPGSSGRQWTNSNYTARHQITSDSEPNDRWCSCNPASAFISAYTHQKPDSKGKALKSAANITTDELYTMHSLIIYPCLPHLA